ncbi:Pumilio-family RNA binding repeat-containing protein [Toxoplasma gondii TgCatPRC2]|uniref:Pumilio-family RNA binding repeat-containing protein n=1 Tax=Toxoplasma gondii TgCatPRC2 TaxID=1130821 RepID=A0A151HMA2_TOXGO|nr:Pumilio-family RNA binding repeat-containing protein [Toxoplasma gondii TgCatPRC2]
MPFVLYHRREVLSDPAERSRYSVHEAVREVNVHTRSTPARLEEFLKEMLTCFTSLSPRQPPSEAVRSPYLPRVGATMSLGNLEACSPAAGCREGRKVNFCSAASGPGNEGNAVTSPSAFPSSTMASPVLTAVSSVTTPPCQGLVSGGLDISPVCGSGGLSSSATEKRTSFFQPFDGEIPRPTSAPPHLEKSSSTLFAFPPSGSTPNRLIDIRCDELYQEFYRNLSQTNPKLPKPLEEDQSFLDLASQKKDRRRSTRAAGYYNGPNREIRGGTSSAANDGISCCPSLSSSFSATSRGNVGAGVTQDEEEGTASRHLPSAAAVNAAALALVDELQHCQDTANLVSTRALSLAVLAAAGGVPGTSGPVVDGAARGGGKAAEETEQSPANLSAAAAAALLQDAHAAWKESGGNAALLPMVQKWTEAILNRCPDAQNGGPSPTSTTTGVSGSNTTSSSHHYQQRSSITTSFCSDGPSGDGSVGASSLRSSQRNRSPPPASSPNSMVFSFPISTNISPSSRGRAGDNVSMDSRSCHLEVDDNGSGRRSRSVSHDRSSRNRPSGFPCEDESLRLPKHASLSASGTPLASVDDVSPVGAHPGASPSSSGLVMDGGFTGFLASPGVSSASESIPASGGQSVSGALGSQGQGRAALTATQQQEQHFLQAVSALRGSPASQAAFLADADPVILAAAASGGLSGVLHPALSVGGHLPANPAAAVALLSAMAGAAGTSSPDGPLGLQHVSSPAMGPLGLDSGFAHAANSSTAGGGANVGAGSLPHSGASGDANAAAMMHALNLAVLGQAFNHRSREAQGDENNDAEAGQAAIPVQTPGAVTAAAAQEAAGNVQLLSSVLYPLLNAQAPASLGMLGGATGPVSSHSAPPGMVLGAARDPRGSMPCMVGTASSLGGHDLYFGGLQHQRGPLGVGDQNLPPAAAALLATATRLSHGTPPGLGLSPAVAHLPVPQGVDVHANFLHQQRAASAAAHQTAAGAGMHASGWAAVGGTSSSTGTTPAGANANSRQMCLLSAQGLESTGTDAHFRAQANLPFGNYYQTVERDVKQTRASGFPQGSDVKSNSGRSRTGRLDARGKNGGQAQQRFLGGFQGDSLDGRSKASSTGATANGKIGAGGRKGDSKEDVVGRLAGVEGLATVTGCGPNGPGTLTVAAAEDLVFGNKYKGNIEMIARDQIGCRMLQRKLSEASPEEVEAIRLEVLECVVVLLVDPFGNYLVQKVVEECEEPQLLQLVRKIRPRLVDICLSPHGTRAVQKLIEVCAGLPAGSAATNELLAALRPSVVLLAKDVNANHVVQKILSSFPASRCDFVFAQVKKNCVEISTERHGCCVMQRCIDAAPPRAKSEILQEIAANALELMQDAFGNYVVQCVLDLQIEGFNGAVAGAIRGHIRELSMQKFSSNVVEKCLVLGTPEQRNLIVDELLAEGDGLKDLLLDSYANYVIQRALTVSSPAAQQQLLLAIQPCLSQLRQTQPGSRVAHKLVKKFPNILAPASATCVAGGDSISGFSDEASKKALRGQAKAAAALKGVTGTNGVSQRAGTGSRSKKKEKADKSCERKGSTPATTKSRRRREETAQFHSRLVTENEAVEVVEKREALDISKELQSVMTSVARRNVMEVTKACPITSLSVGPAVHAQSCQRMSLEGKGRSAAGKLKEDHSRETDTSPAMIAVDGM